MKYICYFLLMCFLFFSAYGARAKPHLDLAESSVDITTGFNGTTVVAFGVIRGMSPQQNMAITLKGLKQKASSV